MRRIALLHTWWFAITSLLLVFGLNYGLNMLTHATWGDLLALAYFGFYGLYCLQNYLGCREYHCLITGPGFILAALLMLLRVTGIFDHGYGLPYLVSGLAVVMGHGLEWRYWKRTGSHFRVTRALEQTETGK